MQSPSPSRRLQRLVFCALMAALSILLGKYLAFNVGEWIRISFENLPILLTALYLGPLAGMAVGVAADLIGCLLVGYAINPLITLGAAAVGLMSGLWSTHRSISAPRLLAAVFLSHLAGSLLIKTLGLSLYYDLPFRLTLGWRALTYALTGTAEWMLLWAVGRSQALTKELKRLHPSQGR